MSIRHDIYAAVTDMGAPKRAALVAHMAAAGHTQRGVQTTISGMISRGQLLCGPGRALNRTLRAGRAPLQRIPHSTGSRDASAESAGRRRVAEPTPALQPIWPAIAGAPIGGLRPCIA